MQPTILVMVRATEGSVSNHAPWSCKVPVTTADAGYAATVAAMKPPPSTREGSAGS